MLGEDTWLLNDKDARAVLVIIRDTFQRHSTESWNCDFPLELLIALSKTDNPRLKRVLDTDDGPYSCGLRCLCALRSGGVDDIMNAMKVRYNHMSPGGSDYLRRLVSKSWSAYQKELDLTPRETTLDRVYQSVSVDHSNKARVLEIGVVLVHFKGTRGRMPMVKIQGGDVRVSLRPLWRQWLLWGLSFF